eukprot:scaffold26027_cov70-Attheya_sp.AAC.5
MLDGEVLRWLPLVPCGAPELVLLVERNVGGDYLLISKWWVPTTAAATAAATAARLISKKADGHKKTHILLTPFLETNSLQKMNES